ncbi:MAG TPA: rhamnulokinase family protein [Euzebya sp.]|nr:rhamnulokinase family protein [Euzebya sp.]
MQVRVAAIDLGASSGRVMLGRVGEGCLDLTEVHRFPNGPVDVGGRLFTDVLALHRDMLAGLREIGGIGDGLDGVGIDSWAVDHGLLDVTGALLGNPVHYRDARTDGVMERFGDRVPAAEVYATTGLQNLPFNTLYQLIAAADSPQMQIARTMLLIPDLLAYWLTGEVGAELTNASTTQLMDVTRRRWATDLAARAGIKPDLLPALREPGTTIGPLTGAVTQQTGLPDTVPVIAVASHDTASAVVAVPASTSAFAYISCGTWSLVGLELDTPVLTEASRAANFTNELGVDGTVRYLRNVMGLWLLQESRRTWSAQGQEQALEDLLAAAASARPFAAIIDPDDPVFLPPGDMPSRIAEACRRSGQVPPADRAGVVRCILDSLALAHRRALGQAQQLADREVEVVHLVGGGSRNALLCQLTADACGLPVIAGPVEATAVGNVLVQARTLGAVQGGLAEMRLLVADTQVLRRYEPSGDTGRWRAADARLG